MDFSLDSNARAMMPMTDVQMKRLEWSVMGLEGLGGLMIVGAAERGNFRLAFRDERVFG